MRIQFLVVSRFSESVLDLVSYACTAMYTDMDSVCHIHILSDLIAYHLTTRYQVEWLLKSYDSLFTDTWIKRER